MRKPYIAGNWKMFGDRKSVTEYIDAFAATDEAAATRDIVICPPFTLLQYWNEYVPSRKPCLSHGAQDVHWEKEGAFTGNVSIPMLIDSGCKQCIVGHSERRAYHAETDAQINKKMNALLDASLIPIVCVGETLEQREAGNKENVVGGQIDGSVLSSADRKDLEKIGVAYEPVWAIGTGVTATSEQAQEMCRFIRERLRSKIGPVSDAIRILYGGSVKPGNIAEIMSQPDIDGVLVGGASLKASDFSAIANY